MSWSRPGPSGEPPTLQTRLYSLSQVRGTSSRGRRAPSYSVGSLLYLRSRRPPVARSTPTPFSSGKAPTFRCSLSRHSGSVTRVCVHYFTFTSGDVHSLNVVPFYYIFVTLLGLLLPPHSKCSVDGIRSVSLMCAKGAFCFTWG